MIGDLEKLQENMKSKNAYHTTEIDGECIITNAATGIIKDEEIIKQRK